MTCRQDFRDVPGFNEERKMTDMSMQHALATKQVVLADSERQRCEIWTRVMGYHRPVSSFNIGKKGEFHERRYFSEQSARLAG
jgi:hypothetical protein